MAVEIVWSPSAVVDLEEIVEYISRDSIIYGAKVAERILEAIERLSEFPKMGRMLPEMNHPDVRDLIVYSYRIVYRVKGDRIQIVRIIHGMRDLGRIMGESGL